MKRVVSPIWSSIVIGSLLGGCAADSVDETSTVEQAASTTSSGSVTATLQTTSSWSGGFCQSVTIKNTGAQVTNWKLAVATNGATISSLWSAKQATSGTTMTVTPESYNAGVPTNGSVSFGFCGSGNTQPTLTSISVTGGSTGTGGASSTGGTTSKGGSTAVGGTTARGGSSAAGGTTARGGSSSTGGISTCAFPTSFKWSSSGVLTTPKGPSGQNWASLKDFTVTKANGKYVVYGSFFNNTNAAYGGFMLTTSDLNQMGSATQIPLSRGAVAPTLVYFTPKKTWVLLYQWGFQYATSTDPTNPSSWQWGKSLLSGGPSEAIDQTFICDSSTCYLFFAGDNGKIYRSSMPIGNFPGTFSGYTTIMSDTQAKLFEGVQVYSVKGTGKYLMIVEAMGSGGRYFRAFSATSLGGSWTAMSSASTEATPFAGKNNVTFPAGRWTNDISHGDLVREDPSETQPVDPCNMKMLYQGRDPSSTAGYNALPYRPGLLTKTN
jgi:hypothetical protein